ncbi:MAG TPA: response regulator [Planctomycetota bacterium]|nr:response regulator [Planctomycetota bacterium]
MDRAPESTAGRVLVVEDNPVNQKITRRVLERAGYTVDVVPNGRAALAAVAKSRYLVVLMDCRLEDIDGPETARRIRALPEPASRVPIVACTGTLGVGDEERCRAAGMNGYLAKPFEPAQLLETIARFATPGAEGGPAPARAPRAKAEASTAVDADVLEMLSKVASLKKGASVISILDLYLRDAPARVARITELASAGDSAGLAQAAHSLKSSSATLGARRLAALCAELELHPDMGAAQARHLTARIAEEWLAVRAEMYSARQRLKTRS